MYRMIFLLIILVTMLVLTHHTDAFNLKDKELLLYFSFDGDKGIDGNTMVGSWGPNAQKFNGLIDEVMLWDRALTEKEIAFSMDPSSADVEASGKLATTWARIKK